MRLKTPATTFSGCKMDFQDEARQEMKVLFCNKKEQWKRNLY
jgi:hypothetical protein